MPKRGRTVKRKKAPSRTRKPKKAKGLLHHVHCKFCGYPKISPAHVIHFTWKCINCKRKTSPWTFKAAFLAVVEAFGDHVHGALGGNIVSQGNALANSNGFDLLTVAGALNQWCNDLTGTVNQAKLDDIKAIVITGLYKDMMTAMMSIQGVVETF